MCLMVTVIASYQLAERLGAGRWSVLAPVLLLGCWHLVWMGGQAAADLLVLIAVVAAVEALVDDGGPRWLDLGLACGLAVASKYTAALPVAAVLTVALVSCRRRWRDVLLAGVLTTVTASFVLIRNLVLTGNPVFPLLWPVLGGSGWTARDHERWTSLVRTGVDTIASVPSAVVAGIRPPGGLGWWFLVAVVLAVCGLVRAGAAAGRRRQVAAVAVLVMAGWLFASHTVRFAFPLAALVAVLAAAGAAALPRKLKAAAALVVGVSVVHGLYLLGDFSFGKLQIQRMWTGEATPDEWRHRVTVNDPMPAYRSAAARLHPSARLLVVGEGRSWGCEVPHHVSSSYDLQQVQEWTEDADSAEEVARRIAASGWSHLLINRGELRRLGGPDFQVLRWANAADAERWSSFLDEWTIPLEARPPCELRVLRPPYTGPNSHGR
jgi:hypothetical protein